MDIQFLNHASVKFYTEDAVIVTDPWYENTAFDNGWALLHEDPGLKEEALHDATHIWVSHEHPDHFVPAFFLSMSDEEKERITILFQKTRDQRVVGFLKAKGFRVIEIKHEESIFIGNTEVSIGQVSFYDSYLLLRDSTATVLNINDCPARELPHLYPISRHVGRIDVLMTQFSYAGWKGGEDYQSYRDLAAREKLDVMSRQTNHFRPKYMIPYASFVHFCHEENSFMNRGHNSLHDALAREEEHCAETIMMKPGDRWEIGTAYDGNEAAMEFWDQKTEVALNAPREQSPDSVSIEELREGFEVYRERIYKNNNRFFLWLARHNPVMKAFLPLRIDLHDLGKFIDLSLYEGIVEVDPEEKPFDAQLHSSTLQFILKNEFGFDTLCVNGRFEASPDGFTRMAKSLAVGSLNNMGMGLGWKTVFKPWLWVRFIPLVFQVKSRMEDSLADA